MKKLTLIIILAALLASCATRRYCRPSPGSPDYAVVTRLMHDQDGIVYVRARLYRQEFHANFKCLPDSIKVGARVNVENWEKI